MIGALFYLRFTSLKNQIAVRTLRLREPKYLAGALATAAYFYYFVFRRLGASYPGSGAARARAAMPPQDVILIGFTLVFLLLMIGWVAYAWLFPASKPALRFSPAEIGFLFPAPVSRRTLVHFSLLSSQMTILFSSLLLGLVWSRRGFTFEGAAMRVVGWWIIISTANFHKSGANLAFAQFAERGFGMARARIAAIAAVGLYFSVLAVSLWREAHVPTLADLSTAPALAGYVARLLDLGPLHWLLAPFRLLVSPFLAPNGQAFLMALPPALLILAAHYIWVVRLEVSFAEGSIAQAEKRALAVAGREAGIATPISVKARPGPFRLASRGRPEVAFLWKNLLAISNTVNWRGLIVVAALLFQAAAIGISLSASTHRGHIEVALVVVGIASVAAFYVLLIGPQLARQDLRSDLANVDLLKTYPLPGWQLVVGELLAPIAILSSLLWLLLLVAAWALAFAPIQSTWLAFEPRMVATICLACVVPPLCALELIVPNAAMLLFPAWHQVGRTRGGGIELMGQRLIFVFGQLIAFVLMLLPAILSAIVLIFATQWLVGLSIAVIFATIAVLAIIGGEIWCGVWWLGERFEKLDLSKELKNG
jgi:hypothetical protein